MTQAPHPFGLPAAAQRPSLASRLRDAGHRAGRLSGRRTGRGVERRLVGGLRAAAAGLLAAGWLWLALGPAAAWAQEERIVLSRPWARLRSQPVETSRAVAVVYGNDVLEVLERQDGWLKVRKGPKAAGWLSPQDAGDAPPAPPQVASAATGGGSLPAPPETKPARSTATFLPPPGPKPSSNPASASALRRMGYEEAARRKLTEILLRERDTPAAYEATQEMLTYHPVGNLPPLQNGRVPAAAHDEAARLRTSVLLQEADALVGEGKSWDAVLLYQAMVQGEPNNGRAYIALLDLLTDVMQKAASAPNMDDLGLAISIYRKSFPDLALPAAVQARMDKK